jgi:hypothetical protein
MSIEAIRSAFMAAGKGVLRLTHAGLACKDSHFASLHVAFDHGGLFALFRDGQHSIAVSQSA